MDKCWYCIVEGGAKGPFTIEELRKKPYFSSESLVWKPGFADWIPAKEVEELFPKEEEESFEAPEEEEFESEDGVAAMEEKEPPVYTNWLILLLLVLIYYLFRLLTS